jgi:acetyltransferase-like isoleucine patch superfamily enzyme
VGDQCVFEQPLILNAVGSYKNLEVGNRCYIGKNVLLDLKGRVIIGDNVTISMGSSLITHLDVGRSKLQVVFPACVGMVEIGSNSYIGANATILSVKVGEFCVVGAGALVNHDVPPNSLAVGVPARVIRRIDLDTGSE